ncbi:hypothetical protein Tco_1139449 [Tanacetum coccineum]
MDDFCTSLFNLVQHNVDNFKTIVDIDWRKCEDDKWQKPITHEITVLVKNLLISLAAKTKSNANEFESAIKEEMFDNLPYVQSLEKEVDELESEKAEFSNKYDLLLQECFGKDILSHCVALELKNQALQSGQHGSVLKDVVETKTINIELEHNVAKLLEENENLHKEKEHLK